MNNIRLYSILITCLIHLSFFAQGKETKVSNEAFNGMLKELLQHSVTEVLPEDCNNREEILYLDTRERKEYDVSHLPNAKWVGYTTFAKKRINDIPKDTKIVVYCTVGYRSEKIAEKLLKMGYQNVANLYGGIFEWIHSGKNVVNDSITNNVHTYNKEWAQWVDGSIANKIYEK